MNVRLMLCALVALAAFSFAACQGGAGDPAAESGDKSQPAGPKQAAALPDGGFKAQITLAYPPARLRVGQKETLKVNVRNVSDAQWYARGGEINTNPDNRFYIAAGNRWLEAEGERLVTNMDGRYGLPNDLQPGEETEVPLQITAPQNPGDYFLEVDLIQEQVAWFSDKGSPTARVRITVVR